MTAATTAVTFSTTLSIPICLPVHSPVCKFFDTICTCATEKAHPNTYSVQKTVSQASNGWKLTKLCLELDLFLWVFFLPINTAMISCKNNPSRHPPRERKIPGSNPSCAGVFTGSSHTSDLKIGTPVATLPGAWRYRVSTRTGCPGVSILWLGEVEHWICNFYLSVAARKIVCADLSLRYTLPLLGR